MHVIYNAFCVYVPPADALVPGTRRILRPTPLQHLQVAPGSSSRADPLAPGARVLLAPGPAEDVQQALSRGC